MHFIGIDPGVSGGIAKITDERVIFACPTPDRHEDILRLLYRSKDGIPMFGAIEHVWSQPGWGHSASFRFGVSFGTLRMALSAREISHTLVLPRTWQNALGVKYPPKVTSTVKKNITKARAQELFPATRVTHAIADALLLAEYARRVYGRA